MNGHVGQTNSQYEDFHGGQLFWCRNASEEDILEFCKAHGLAILNTMFTKQQTHLITYMSGDHGTQIDYHLCPAFMRTRLQDCKYWEAFRYRTPVTHNRIYFRTKDKDV